MAYASKEQKAVIVAALKAVMPKDFKYSVAVRDHSEFVLTISQAPVDLVKLAVAKGFHSYDGHVQLNSHHLGKHFAGTEVGELFAKIQNVMFSKDAGYYDDSNAMVDYFDTAYYVSVNLGRFDKGFKVAV